MTNSTGNRDYTGKFLVFAHARSGSTNLCNIIETDKSILMVEEPFHAEGKAWWPDNDPMPVHTSNQQDLIETVSRLYGRYDGIKTLMRHLPDDLNRILIHLPGLKVIHLYRHNLLQSVVSLYISGHSNIWYKNVMDEKNLLHDHEFGPFDIGELRKELKAQSDRVKLYHKEMKKKPAGEVFSISYEELYFSNYERKKELVADIFAFIGRSVPDSGAIDMFLDPALAKMNSKETYDQIPNILEIEEKLGSDETGWLLK